MIHQIILNIESYYPFASINFPKSQTFARKIVRFQDNKTYNQVRNKIQILKNLQHKNIVRLVNVLEGDSVFHLIYQHIDNRFQLSDHSVRSNVGEIRNQLVELFSFLTCSKIAADFIQDNLGIGDQSEVKYYLDIDSFQVNQPKCKRKDYSKDITQMFKHVSAPTSQKCINFEATTNLSLSHNFSQKNNVSHIFRQSSNKEKGSALSQSVATCKKIKPFQYLNMIQQRLEELTKKTKYSPQMRQTFQKRDTVKENWKKQEVITRKFSGTTQQEKKTEKSSNTVLKNRNQEQRYRKPNAFDKILVEKSQQTDGFIINKRPQLQQQNDFQILKKISFQKISKAKSRQNYVQEFLSLLQDDSENIQSINFQQQKQKKSQRFRPKKNIFDILSTGSAKKQKQRIKKAINESNLVLRKCNISPDPNN